MWSMNAVSMLPGFRVDFTEIYNYSTRTVIISLANLDICYSLLHCPVISNYNYVYAYQLSCTIPFNVMTPPLSPSP